MRRNFLIALLAGLAAFAPGLISALPAQADSAAQVLADCNAHDSLTHSYSSKALQDALATMPADMKEYTNCVDVITRAVDSGGGTGKSNGAGSGSGGSFLPTPVIVILVILALAAATFGALEVRRRRK